MTFFRSTLKQALKRRSTKPFQKHCIPSLQGASTTLLRDTLYVGHRRLLSSAFGLPNGENAVRFRLKGIEGRKFSQFAQTFRNRAKS